MRNIDRFRGCLIGGAAGDALGYAVEFCGESEIFGTYGKRGITEYALHHGAALFSDDTQMTLFTANGLLCGGAQKNPRGKITPYVECIRTAYRDWYLTQTESYPAKNGSSTSWLLNIPELFSPRAPGITCMSAIAAGAKGSVKKPSTNSKGCGGVMRVAPIGLYFCDQPLSDGEVDQLGAEAAAMTHGHELGYLPAAALAHIIRAIAERGASPKDAAEEAVYAVSAQFSNAKHIDDFIDLMMKALSLAATATDDLSAIHELGEGWVGDEALAIAVYCAVKYADDFDRALITSVNHKGDSDSTGAVAGNILGAYCGYDAIPQKYKDHLELHDLIIEIADDLYAFSPITADSPSADGVREAKYIASTYPQ